MQWYYFIALAVVIGCLLLVDKRYTLAFFYNVKRTASTLAIALWLFIIWDIFGIRLGIFFHGDSPYALPARIFPEFPVEEILFLSVLTYSALLLYRFLSEHEKKKGIK